MNQEEIYKSMRYHQSEATRLQGLLESDKGDAKVWEATPVREPGRFEPVNMSPEGYAQMQRLSRTFTRLEEGIDALGLPMPRVEPVLAKLQVCCMLLNRQIAIKHRE